MEVAEATERDWGCTRKSGISKRAPFSGEAVCLRKSSRGIEGMIPPLYSYAFPKEAILAVT
jgi:hypothetical protein